MIPEGRRLRIQPTHLHTSDRALHRVGQSIRLQELRREGGCVCSSGHGGAQGVLPQGAGQGGTHAPRQAQTSLQPPRRYLRLSLPLTATCGSYDLCLSLVRRGVDHSSFSLILNSRLIYCCPIKPVFCKWCFAWYILPPPKVLNSRIGYFHRRLSRLDMWNRTSGEATWTGWCWCSVDKGTGGQVRDNSGTTRCGGAPDESQVPLRVDVFWPELKLLGITLHIY